MMKKKIITSTEANRNFSDLLNKVHYKGESFYIKRGREVIAKLAPVTPTMKAEDFAKLLKSIPKLDDNDLEDFEKIIKKHRKRMGGEG